MLEYLDISLNSWSLILFFFTFLFYLSVTSLIFGGMFNKPLLIITIFTYFINQIVTILYSFYTQQVGFLFLVLLQLFLLAVTYLQISRSGKSIGEEFENK